MAAFSGFYTEYAASKIDKTGDISYNVEERIGRLPPGWAAPEKGRKVDLYGRI